ncbi:unnamed protein product [Ambrosiozyma monospora]|uniref:Unnamed protein product n=1 Tax=Ambrosiozyma monospora TaxID=43982 RepID=A0A9W6YYT7_AMBMO|nr:unnamed protein product [Ambrosiozyma monospora]
MRELSSIYLKSGNFFPTLFNISTPVNIPEDSNFHCEFKQHDHWENIKNILLNVNRQPPQQSAIQSIYVAYMQLFNITTEIYRFTASQFVQLSYIFQLKFGEGGLDYSVITCACPCCPVRLIIKYCCWKKVFYISQLGIAKHIHTVSYSILSNYSPNTKITSSVSSSASATESKSLEHGIESIQDSAKSNEADESATQPGSNRVEIKPTAVHDISHANDNNIEQTTFTYQENVSNNAWNMKDLEEANARNGEAIRVPAPSKIVSLKYKKNTTNSEKQEISVTSDNQTSEDDRNQRHVNAEIENGTEDEDQVQILVEDDEYVFSDHDSLHPQDTNYVEVPQEKDVSVTSELKITNETTRKTTDVIHALLFEQERFTNSVNFDDERFQKSLKGLLLYARKLYGKTH